MVGFVILHYMAYEMTVKCVENLLSQNFTSILSPDDKEQIQVVVVDNASPNGSGQRLLERYSDCENVHVILNDENLGFACGNNIGFDYLKRNYNLDYMIVMNEDVLIQDPMFLAKAHGIFGNKHFAVLGPDINAVKIGKHQNPCYLKGNTKEDVVKIKNRLQMQLSHFIVYYYSNFFISKIKAFVKFILKRIKRQPLPLDWRKEYVNPVLHGSCYVFSKDFINARDYAFYPGTFLYFEEDILHLQCMRQGLKMLYTPELCVTHFQNVSTDMVFKKNIKKMKMKHEQLIKSMDCFIKLCDE